MAINQKVASFLSGLALAGNLGLAKVVGAEEYNPNGYNQLIPNLNGVHPHETLYIDATDKIPNKETYVERFRLADGKIVARISINGHTFAYSVAAKSLKESYGLRDADGDGTFREKYGFKERIQVPEWIINLNSQ